MFCCKVSQVLRWLQSQRQTNPGPVPMLPVIGLQPASMYVCFWTSESVNDFVSQSRPPCSSVVLSVTQVTHGHWSQASSGSNKAVNKPTHTHSYTLLHTHTQLHMIQLSSYCFIGISAEVIMGKLLVAHSQLCWRETFTTPSTSHFITKTLSSRCNGAGRSNN